MKGWLIVNGFVDSTKFSELYSYLCRAAERHGIELLIKTSDTLVGVLGERILGTDRPDFVLFWDKDIHLAKRLEGEGVRLFNNARAIEISDSKILTAQTLFGKVRAPRTVISPKTFEGIGYNKLDFVEESYPFAFKPLC